MKLSVWSYIESLWIPPVGQIKEAFTLVDFLFSKNVPVITKSHLHCQAKIFCTKVDHQIQDWGPSRVPLEGHTKEAFRVQLIKNN